MKKILLFLYLLPLAMSCVTQKTTTSHAEYVVPVYYNGNDEPVAGSVFLYSERQ